MVGLFERRQFLVSCAAYGLGSLAASGNGRQTFKACLRPETLPLSGQDSSGTWIGFGPDLLRDLLRRAMPGAEFEGCECLSWSRALRSVQTGTLHFLLEVNYHPQREHLMDFIGCTDTERAYLVAREDLPVQRIGTLDDFTRLPGNVMVIASSVWDAEFEHRLVTDPEFGRSFVTESNLKAPAHRPGSQHIQTSDAGFDVEMARAILRKKITGIIVGAAHAARIIRAANLQTTPYGPADRLKAIDIDAFAPTFTYLVVSKQVAAKTRIRLRKAYEAARQDGGFETLWSRWYPERALPSDVSRL
ncbi:transporter substrate-binding domain-containing protein [Palleronia caenipelagi]|uniref:transporter substrate-binding domain-containing protein n=1 Tax=Palleronia caenipelagi TaxID=2489174 RepID=UPI001C8F5911|nr:transporter substrate-binding domain-containing protein [Palleronia caenipelagi]